MQLFLSGPGPRHSVYENWNADLGLVLQRYHITVGTRVRGKTAAAAVPRRLHLPARRRGGRGRRLHLHRGRSGGSHDVTPHLDGVAAVADPDEVAHGAT